MNRFMIFANLQLRCRHKGFKNNGKAAVATLESSDTTRNCCLESFLIHPPELHNQQLLQPNLQVGRSDQLLNQYQDSVHGKIAEPRIQN